MAAVLAGEKRLPWPDEWRDRRSGLRRVLGAVFLGAFTVGFTAATIWALLSGDPRTALFLAPLAAGFALVTGLIVRLLRARKQGSPKTIILASDAPDERCLRFPYSALNYYLVIALAAVTVVVLSIWAGSGLTGRTVPPFGTPLSAGTGVLMGIMALACLWAVVEMGRWKVGRCHVALSPRGIHHRGLTFESFTPWYAVDDVRAFSHVGLLMVARAVPSAEARVSRKRWATKQEEFGYLPSFSVRGRSLAVDPALLYHALRYYHAHPEARAELGTEAGLRRVRSGDLLG